MRTSTKLTLAAVSLLLLSSSAWAVPVAAVPDGGSSALLMVLGLAGVTCFRRLFKK